jgi:hypothetical protein
MCGCGSVMHGYGCATCDCLTHSHPTSRSVSCIFVDAISVNAWVWMRTGDCLTFSSNLKVSEAACVYVECGCMGMDAAHATA